MLLPAQKVVGPLVVTVLLTDVHPVVNESVDQGEKLPGLHSNRTCR